MNLIYLLLMHEGDIEKVNEKIEKVKEKIER